MTLLTVDKLSVRFSGTPNGESVVKDASFAIKKGEIFALVGESGSGKSVTALSIMQLHRKGSVSYPSGSIQFESEELVSAGEIFMQTLRGNDISMIFQEPMSALNPLHTIERQIKEIITLHNPMDIVQLEARYQELLDLVELTHLKERTNPYPHQLSGGERQRVMIAMAMANNPKLLIADEPTTALDVHVEQQIIDLLLKLRDEIGMAIMLITHDLNLVRRVADKVAIMRNGELVEQGKTSIIFAKPKHPYTQKLLDSEPKGSPQAIEKKSKSLIFCENLRVAFSLKKNFFGKTTSEHVAVKGSALDVKRGETLGIVGESGSGKTTLGLALARLIPSTGSISFNGSTIDNVSGKPLLHLRKKIQFVFQDPFASLNPRMNIGDIIGEGLTVHSPELSHDERKEAVITMLNEVGLDADLYGRYPHEFSGGQRQRINIARAMILNPKLVILDEPTSALDLNLQLQIIALLQFFQTKFGTSYLFISHDLRVIRAMSHRLIVIKNGEIIEAGACEDVLTSPSHDYTKQLVAAAFPEKP